MRFFENRIASVRYSTCVTEAQKKLIFKSAEFNWVHTLIAQHIKDSGIRLNILFIFIYPEASQ
jgi:hypothetical protein